MPRRSAVAGLLLALAACGGGEAATAPTTGSSSTAPPTTSLGAASTTTTVTTAPSAPSVLALSSGRGDDASFEVAVWFGADPFAADDFRVVVGADVDDDHPGIGDPFPYLDGHLELTSDGAALAVGTDVLASGDGLRDLVSWVWSDGVLRVYFIDTTPARGGTTWVLVEIDGESVIAGTAGAPFGTSCSYHGSGLDLSDTIGIPNAGSPCRYPSG